MAVFEIIWFIVEKLPHLNNPLRFLYQPAQKIDWGVILEEGLWAGKDHGRRNDKIPAVQE